MAEGPGTVRAITAEACLSGTTTPHDTQAAAAPAWRQRHHDLRQPLNALGLFCAALRARPLGTAEQGLVQGIAEALTSLEAMIDAWAAEECRRPDPSITPRQAGNAAPGLDAAAGPSPGAGAPPLILVIDDDTGSRFSTAVLLESWGARVAELDSVAALQAWLRDEGLHVRPGLVLVDYHLGASGTGFEALDCLQSAYPGVRVPALLVTGDEVAVTSAHLRTNLTTLRKPVAPQALLEAVGRHIRPQV